MNVELNHHIHSRPQIVISQHEHMHASHASWLPRRTSRTGISCLCSEPASRCVLSLSRCITAAIGLVLTIISPSPPSSFAGRARGKFARRSVALLSPRAVQPRAYARAYNRCMRSFLHSNSLLPLHMNKLWKWAFMYILCVLIDMESTLKDEETRKGFGFRFRHKDNYR